MHYDTSEMASGGKVRQPGNAQDYTPKWTLAAIFGNSPRTIKARPSAT